MKLTEFYGRKISMFERIKAEIIQEKGIYRAAAIITVIILFLFVFGLFLDIGIALAWTVGVFLIVVFLLNVILPDPLKIAVFSLGAGGLNNGPGIMITLFFMILRRIATFLWWSKWFWACLIAPFAIYFGIADFIENLPTMSDWNSFSLAKCFQNLMINDGGNYWLMIGQFLMICMSICSIWHFCGKVLKYISEN